MRDGTFEYQVSDGKVGERTVSYDFKTLAKARKQLYESAFGKEFMNLPDDMKGTLQTHEEE